MNDLFAFNRELQEAFCAQLTSQTGQTVKLLTGKVAFADASNKVVMRRSAEETLLKVGDQVLLPEEVNDQFICCPVSAGGNPITRPMCTLLRDGEERVVELWPGTLKKSKTDRKTGEVVSVGGNLPAFIAGCITREDLWLRLLGCTLTVVDAHKVPVVARNWKDQTTYETETWIYDFDVEEPKPVARRTR